MTLISYQTVASYASVHSKDALDLSKTLTAWIYTSRHTYSDPSRQKIPDVKKITDLDSVMYGACGFMQLLLEKLLNDVGIKTRQVCFWDVPVQGGHTALEALINGKWIFFDPTFGMYFEDKKGAPLSLEDARSNWPNVNVIHAEGLPGWSGVLADPNLIKPNTVYSVRTNPFFDHPDLVNKGFKGITGEITSLILGTATVREKGEPFQYVNDGERSTKTFYDLPNGYNYTLYSTYINDPGKYDWRIKQIQYDQKNNIDSKFVVFDNRDVLFVDYDQLNQYEWKENITFSERGCWVSKVTTIFDDNSKIVWIDDVNNQYNYKTITRTYSDFNQILKSEIFTYDNGTKSYVQYDTQNISLIKLTRTNFFNNTPQYTVYTHDDESSYSVSWVGKLNNNVDLSLTYIGSSSSDYVTGSNNDDQIYGGLGPDLLFGGLGNDVYYVENIGDLTIEDKIAGIDTINSSINYILPDNFENLYLTGSAIQAIGNDLNNYLCGNAANNILYGLGGNDTLNGGAGNDTLIGGLGSDQFIWRSINESSKKLNLADKILDFSSLDTINLSSMDANSDLSQLQKFSYIGEAQFSKAGQVRIEAYSDKKIIELNVNSDLSADSIIVLIGSNININSENFIL